MSARVIIGDRVVELSEPFECSRILEDKRGRVRKTEVLCYGRMILRQVEPTAEEREQMEAGRRVMLGIGRE